MKFCVVNIHAFHHHNESAQENQNEQTQIEQLSKFGIGFKNDAENLALPFFSFGNVIVFSFHHLIGFKI